MAAGSAFANYGINTIPFFVFYSMFGLQRAGDLAWAAGDMQTRGFLVGGTPWKQQVALMIGVCVSTFAVPPAASFCPLISTAGPA